MADLLKQDLQETVSNGFLQYQLTEVYRVTNTRATGPVSTLADVGLPQPFTSKIVSGAEVWLRSRQLQVQNPEDAASEKLVTCIYTNNTEQFPRDANGDQVTTPDGEVDYVEIGFANSTEPVTDAILVSITQNNPYHTASGGDVLANPSWIPALKPGPVTNSAGKPVLVERQVSNDQITIWRTAATWDNAWNNYVGKINTDSFTVTQSDSSGTKFSKTYAPYTLLIDTVHKRDLWRDAILYFKVGFQMIHNPKTWIHSEVDRGTERRVEVGQYKPDGTTYTAQDLTDLKIGGSWGYEAITTLDEDGDKTAISEPVKFNGTGAEMPLDRIGGASYTNTSEVYLNYLIHDEIAFTPLVS